MISEMTFTSDWVTNKATAWLEILGHLRRGPTKGLEIGVFEGRSSKFWLEEILVDPGSVLHAVDPWADKSAENRERIAADPVHGSKFVFHSVKGQVAMAGMLARGEGMTFDFAYVDGGKEAHVVLEQMVGAWLLLKPGGVLIVDDYEWKWTPGCVTSPPTNPPRDGVDAFLSAYAGFYGDLRKGWQASIKKL